MAPDTHKHLAMLRILYGACAAALDAFHAADNPVDEELIVDLETMVTRTQGETNDSRHISQSPRRLLGSAGSRPVTSGSATRGEGKSGVWRETTRRVPASSP
jgi:hypothetical protein